MKTLLVMFMVMACAAPSRGADASQMADEAAALAIAEPALIAKFGADEVTDARPFRVRILVPGRVWQVEGSRPRNARGDERLFAAVRFEDGDLRVTVMKRVPVKRSNKAIQPATLSLSGWSTLIRADQRDSRVGGRISVFCGSRK